MMNIRTRRLIMMVSLIFIVELSKVYPPFFPTSLTFINSAKVLRFHINTHSPDRLLTRFVVLPGLIPDAGTQQSLLRSLRSQTIAKR